MSDQSCQRCNLGDVAHKPEQQIDAMNRLIHERASAVEFPRAAPCAAVVILLGAVPFDDRVA